MQENLRKCCRLAAFAGILHSFLALELNKIIFLLRWMKIVQDCLQIVLSAVRGLRMTVAIAGAAGLAWCRAIARLRCGAGVAVRMLRLRSEFR